MNAETILLKWAERYLRNKDILRKEIKGIKKESDRLIIEKNDEVKTCIASPKLSEVKAEIVVTLNNKENIHKLADRWDYFCKVQDLKILFVNPFSGGDMVWAIKPYVHEMICDRKTLKQGFFAMAECVEPITEERLLSYQRS